MPGRVSKAVRKAVNETVRSLVYSTNGDPNTKNPYQEGTRPHALFNRLYANEANKYRFFEQLHQDMMGLFQRE